MSAPASPALAPVSAAGSAEAVAAAIDGLRARVGESLSRLPGGTDTTRRLTADAERAIADLSVAFGCVEAAIARIDVAVNVRLVTPSTP